MCCRAGLPMVDKIIEVNWYARGLGWWSMGSGSASMRSSACTPGIRKSKGAVPNRRPVRSVLTTAACGLPGVSVGP